VVLGILWVRLLPRKVGADARSGSQRKKDSMRIELDSPKDYEMEASSPVSPPSLSSSAARGKYEG